MVLLVTLDPGREALERTEVAIYFIAVIAAGNVSLDWPGSAD